MSARLTARDHALRLIHEDALSEWIVGRPDLNRPHGLAQRLGWRVAVRRRTVLARGSSKRAGDFAGDVGMRGFPDLVLVHRAQGRIIYAELKSETGKPSEHQIEWLNDLAAPWYHDADGTPLRLNEVYLWRPRHMDVLPALLSPRFGELPVGVDLGAWPVPDDVLAAIGVDVD